MTLKSIGGILARNPQGRLPTSLPQKKIEKVKCVDCGDEFDLTIWFREDGSEIVGSKLCRGCAEKKRENERRQETEEKLKAGIQKRRRDWVNEANVPARFGASSFDNFDAKLQRKAFDAVKNLRWQFNDDGGEPRSLVLLSPGLYGVGKTHLISALLNQILKTEEVGRLDKYLSVHLDPCPCSFNTETQILARIRATFNRTKRNDDSEQEADIYARLARYDLLVIDDVGKVRPRDFSFLQGVYFTIIDQRYNDSQSIILTTNLDLSQLEEHIGGACADRLLEMVGKEGFIQMVGKSYRARN